MRFISFSEMWFYIFYCGLASFVGKSSVQGQTAKSVKNFKRFFQIHNNNFTYSFIVGKRHYLPERKVKNYMYQLIKSVEHMHR